MRRRTEGRAARGARTAGILATALAMAATLPARADEPAGGGAVAALLHGCVTPMDLGLSRMELVLQPVFAGIGAAGRVVWDGDAGRVRVLVEGTQADAAEATRAWAEDAASLVRARLGVDPDEGELLDPRESGFDLASLFATATLPPPPADELAALIELRFAVHRPVSMSPNWYRADLLDDEVWMAHGPDR